MPKLHLAAVLLFATPLLAQQTGVSHPAEAEIEATSDPAIVAPAAPVVSAPVLVVPAKTDSAAPVTPGVDDSPAVTLKRHDLAQFDPDARVVGDEGVPVDNVAAGTLLRARMKTAVQTATTQPGTPFRAEVTEALLHEGRVIVPAGAVVEGRVTDVRGGRRIHGPALIHLQAQAIVLPDGSRMPVHASIVDTDQFGDTRIDGEGNIVRKAHTGQTLATVGLAAGSGAAAGGLIAGVPGALVGAGIGAGVSTVLWLKADRQAELPADSLVVLALDTPLPIEPLVREPDYAQRPAETVPAPVAQAPAQSAPQAFVPVE